MNEQRNSIATETQMSSLEQLLVNNDWARIVGDSINDCLFCNGLKSITVHNNENGFVMSVLFDENLLKKFFNIEDVLNDALLIYFIQEYYNAI